MPRIIPRVIHQHIHPPKPLHHLINRPSQRSKVGQIAAKIYRRTTTRIDNPHHQRLRRVLLNIQKRDMSLLPHKRLDDRLTNPARPTRHQHHAIYQARVHRLIAHLTHRCIIACLPPPRLTPTSLHWVMN
jgi:hypothetical protein